MNYNTIIVFLAPPLPDSIQLLHMSANLSILPMGTYHCLFIRAGALPAVVEWAVGKVVECNSCVEAGEVSMLEGYTHGRE